MSDKVQYNLERSVNELHAYKNLQIFNDNELNEIIESRKDFEYRLQRSNKLLLDYLEYIEYEKKLAKIIKKRCKTKSFKYVQRKIIYLFKQAINYFNDDRLIKMFVDYALKLEEFEILKDFFVEYYNKNPKNYDFVILAASSCLRFDDYECARLFFIKGLRMNEDCKILYLEFYKMELLYLDRCKKINEEVGIQVDEKDDVDNGQLCKNIFDAFYAKFRNSKEIEEFKKLSVGDSNLIQYIENIING
ncbi:U3 snoRNP protein [Gurleya vavrai]